jgi:formate dehydrogenase maturation protein FdhE
MRIRDNGEDIDAIPKQFGNEFDSHPVEVLVFVTSQRALDREPQQFSQEPCDNCKDNGIEYCPLCGSGIEKSIVSNLVDDLHEAMQVTSEISGDLEDKLDWNCGQ